MNNPISKKEQDRISRRTRLIWKSRRFILIRSAEGPLATPVSVMGLRPATEDELSE